MDGSGGLLDREGAALIASTEVSQVPRTRQRQRSPGVPHFPPPAPLQHNTPPARLDVIAAHPWSVPCAIGVAPGHTPSGHAPLPQPLPQHTASEHHPFLKHG